MGWILVRLLIEAATTTLLLHGISGLEVKKNRKYLAFLLMGLIGTVAMALLMDRTILGLSEIVRYAGVALLPVFMFGIKRLGVVMACVMTADSIETFVAGNIMLINERMTVFDSPETIRLIYEIATLTIVCILTIGLGKRKLMNLQEFKYSQLCGALTAIILYIMTFTFSWINFNDANYVILVGLRSVINGFGRLMLIIVVILCAEIWTGKKELLCQLAFNQKCIKEQTEQYEFLNSTQRKLRKFRHDSIAHLTAIEYMAANNETEKIKGYVNKLLGEYDKTKYISTGNIIGDAVINQCYQKCKESGVNISVIGSFSAEMKIDETDLCVILTNILSNAYEAAIKCERRIVRIEMSSFGGTQFIRATNSAVESTITSDGELCISESSKKDKSSHGFGIQNVKDAVRRCGGKVRWDRTDNFGYPMIMTEVELPLNIQ